MLTKNREILFSIILRIFLGGDGIHLVVDENGKFREDNFAEAIGKLGGGSETGGKAKRQKDGSDCYNIVKMIMERNFAPVIVFSFSKKECEAYALQMAKLDFNTRKFDFLTARKLARSGPTSDIIVVVVGTFPFY